MTSEKVSISVNFWRLCHPIFILGIDAEKMIIIWVQLPVLLLMGCREISLAGCHVLLILGREGGGGRGRREGRERRRGGGGG